MFRAYRAVLTGLLAAAFLSACASVRPSKEGSVGLAYSLPNRMIDVTTQFTAAGQVTIAVAGGEYYPDPLPDAQRMVEIRRSWIGKNDVKLATTNGLLSSASATYTGQADDFAQSIGAFLGTRQQALFAMVPKKSPCERVATVKHSVPLAQLLENSGTYAFNALGLSGNGACDEVIVTIHQLDAQGKVQPLTQITRHPVPDDGKGGLWYRANKLYLVEARSPSTGGWLRTPVFLPDQSPAYRIKMQNGVFASTTTDLKFSNGMLTSYERSADSEVIALLKLPAGVIGAYAESVGQVFANFKAVDATGADEQLHEIRMLLFAQQVEACKNAIATKQPEATINELCAIEPPK